MAQNLRLDDFQVPFWTAYIEERRLELGLKESELMSPHRSHQNYGKLNSIFLKIVIIRIFEVARTPQFILNQPIKFGIIDILDLSLKILSKILLSRGFSSEK